MIEPGRKSGAVPLPNSGYHDPQLLDRECAELPNSVWFFLCSRRQLLQHNDYVSRRIFGIPVIAQNFQGELRGFKNVCSHRSAPLRLDRAGNALLRCPYHGWTYNVDGVPIGIPGNEDLFGLSRECKPSLALGQFALSACGDLIFVHCGRVPPQSLRDYLGKYYGILERLSQTCQEPIHADTMNFEANWKICVENTLDEYHISTVHPTNFGQNGLLRTGEYVYDFNGLHSGMRQHREGNERIAPDYLMQRLNERPFRYDAYSIFFLFPNTVITISGSLMIVQSYAPTGPEQTRIDLDILSADEAPLSDARRKKLAVAVAYLTGVFDEDKRVCEFMAIGTRDAERPSMFGAQEARLAHFQTNYARLMTI